MLFLSPSWSFHKLVVAQAFANAVNLSLAKAVQPDGKIILMMKQDPVGIIKNWLPDIKTIPDQLIRNRLLSLSYYIAEFRFAARFEYYLPTRVLTSGDTFENIQRWTNSTKDLSDAYNQMLDAMLYYAHDRSDVQLQAMSSVAAAALERHQLELVEGIDAAVSLPDADLVSLFRKLPPQR